MARFQNTEKAVRELDSLLDSLIKKAENFSDALVELDNISKKQSKSQSDLKNKAQQLAVVDRELIKLDKQMERAEAQLTEEYKQVQKALIKKQEAAKKAAAALKEEVTGAKAAKEAARKQKEEARALNKAHAEAIKINDKLNKSQKRTGGLFKSVTKSIVAAGAAMFGFNAALNTLKKAFNTIKDFEKGMSEVKAITGATDEEFKLLEKDAIRLGSTTQKTASDVSALQKEFAKLGFSTNEILNATEATISLSIAAGSDLAESAVVAASTIRGFNLATTETQRVVDVMAKSFTSSALDLEKFKVAMAIAAPVANSFGKDIEFTTAQLAVLSDAGLDASTAGTSLRNMFLELSKRGMTWEEGLERINNSTNKNNTALKLFGKRGATAALILADNTEKAKGLEEAFDNAKGTAQSMADTMADNLAGDIDKAKSAWEGFILSLNQGNTTISQSSRVLVQLFTDAFNRLSDPELFKKWKKNTELVAEDYDKFIENMGILESSHGRTLKTIIQQIEKQGSLNLTNKEFFDNIEFGSKAAEESFKNMASFYGIADSKINGLWEAYLRKRRSLYEGELQAESDAQAAKLIKEQEILDAKNEQEKKAAEERYQIWLKKENERKAREEELSKSLAVFKDGNIKNETIAEKGKFDQKKELEDQYTAYLQEQEAKRTEAKRIEAEKQALIEENTAKLRETFLNSANQILSEQYGSYIDNRLEKTRVATESEQQILKNNLDKGLITEKEYKDQSTRLNLRLKQKEAEAQKKKDLFDLFLDTAKSVASVKIQAGVLLANPLTAPYAAVSLSQIPFILGTSAAAGAVIAARPIPKFGYGSHGKIKEDIFAEIGDRFQREAVIFPDGSVVFSDNKPQTVPLKKGTEVLSGEQTKEFIKDRGIDTELMKEMIISQKETTKAINKMAIRTRTDKGIIEEGNNYRNSYIK